MNPKRDISNHPAAKLWNEYEMGLYRYLCIHIKEWESRGYETPTNHANMWMLSLYIPKSTSVPDFITPELIQAHRSVLITKMPEHYGPLWPDCPKGLQMQYDWKKE